MMDVTRPKYGPRQPSAAHQFAVIVPEIEARKSLEKFVSVAGSAKALAGQWDISEQYLCDLRKGRRAFTDDILDRLGFRRVMTFKLTHP